MSHLRLSLIVFHSFKEENKTTISATTISLRWLLSLSLLPTCSSQLDVWWIDFALFFLLLVPVVWFPSVVEKRNGRRIIILGSMSAAFQTFKLKQFKDLDLVWSKNLSSLGFPIFPCFYTLVGGPLSVNLNNWKWFGKTVCRAQSWHVGVKTEPRSQGLPVEHRDEIIPSYRSMEDDKSQLWNQNDYSQNCQSNPEDQFRNKGVCNIRDQEPKGQSDWALEILCVDGRKFQKVNHPAALHQSELCWLKDTWQLCRLM